MKTKYNRLQNNILVALAELEKVALDPFENTKEDLILYHQMMEYIKSKGWESEYYEWYSYDEFIDK